jgi:DNA-binding winged helix-turn-helix (wHTH) protein/predicted ATPase
VVEPAQRTTFGRFRFDAANGCVWQGATAIPLRPKACAVLKHLIDHAGQLVTKQQLLEAVWPATFVGDAVLKDCIRQVREALGDDAASPTYIATSHRRGYRFIARLSETAAGPASGTVTSAVGQFPLLEATRSAARVPGHDTELATLRGWCERALGGERQIAFITGEAGIGKTTLLNALLGEMESVAGIRILQGQCLQHYGHAEAYLPVLEALSQCGRGPAGAEVIELLQHYAPSWLPQLRSLLSVADKEQLPPAFPGSTRERMLREMAEAIEAMAADALLLVVLEDLQWSDYSTLDLISYLGRRRDPARLLVLGTYRPVDVILGEHPLKDVKRELQAHGKCYELPVPCVSEEVVAEYVAERCPGHQFPGRLTRMIHRRTEGNPLFMVHVVEHLIDEKAIVEEQGQWRLRGDLTDVESGIPENIRQVIETQIERLSDDERRVLEAASVVGMECSSTAIAAALDVTHEWVEPICEALVTRHRFLTPGRLVVLPDGTLTPRYMFGHVLYLDVLYQRLPVMLRAQMHRQIGAVGEVIYKDRIDEIVAELAMHFEQGQDRVRALKYLARAAETALQRSAHHEAAALARRGLRALEGLPASAERDQRELRLRMILSISLVVTKGFAATDLEDVYGRAWDLCRGGCPIPDAFRVLRLMGLSHMFRAELATAHGIAEKLADMAEQSDDPALTMEAHRALGGTSLELGRLTDALGHLEEASSQYKADRHARYVGFTGHDPKVVSDCAAARALWALGYPDQALDKVTRALRFAQELAHVQSVVTAAYYAAHIHHLRGDPMSTRDCAAIAVGLAEEQGLELWAAVGRIHQAWAAGMLGDRTHALRQLPLELEAYEATGARVWRPHFLGLFAEALAGADRTDEALGMVEDGLTLARETSEHYFIAELYRLKGELLLRSAGDVEAPSVALAEECFAQALTIARDQQARSWELRTVMSVAGLYARQGRRQAARMLVQDTYTWFEEGHDTADLRAANRALHEPASGFHPKQPR